MRKGADVSIAKQPCDLGNCQASVGQMAICEIGSKAFQEFRECEPFLRQPPGKRSLAQPELACNLAGSCLAVRQQWNNDILDACLEWTGVSWPTRNRFLAIGNQKVIEIGIGANDGRLPDAVRERNVIGGSAEFDIITEEFEKFCIRWPPVLQSHAFRPKTKTCELLACPQQDRHPEFDLVLIQMATDTDIVDRYANGFTVDTSL